MIGFAVGLYIEFTSGVDFPHQIMGYIHTLKELIPSELPTTSMPDLSELPNLPSLPDLPDLPDLPEAPSLPEISFPSLQE